MPASAGAHQQTQLSDRFSRRESANQALEGDLLLPMSIHGAISESRELKLNELERSEQQTDSRSIAMDAEKTGGGSTSMSVFVSYLANDPSTGEIDASKILSAECFSDWLKVHARKYRYGAKMTNEKAFQRALTAHVTGNDGRKPFTPEQEVAVLVELRKKRPWPAFGGKLTLGAKGFRSFGFHEKKRFVRVAEPPKVKVPVVNQDVKPKAPQQQNDVQKSCGKRRKLAAEDGSLKAAHAAYPEPLEQMDTLYDWINALEGGSLDRRCQATISPDLDLPLFIEDSYLKFNWGE